MGCAGFGRKFPDGIISIVKKLHLVKKIIYFLTARNARVAQGPHGNSRLGFSLLRIITSYSKKPERLKSTARGHAQRPESKIKMFSL